MREWLVSTLGGGATALAIVVAVIGLAGALGGAATSYIIAQQTVYVNSITAERMKWVNLLRANIATIMTTMNRIRSHTVAGEHAKAETALKDYDEILKLRHSTVLQLNPGGLIDGVVIQIIDALLVSIAGSEQKHMPGLLKTLQAHSQWLLKAEWERIKYEARSPLGKLRKLRQANQLKTDYLIFFYGPHSGMPLVRRLNGR